VFFLFRVYEATVRDLTHPATTGHLIGKRIAAPPTGLKVQLPHASGRAKMSILQSGRSRTGGAV
jgi:hypothetical protein